MSDDLISRSALKEAMWDESHSIATFTECGTEEARFGLTASEIEEIINNAPTVEYTFEEAFQKTVCEQRLYCPERPQGEWISHIRSIECSVCKYDFFADDENENCQDYEPCTDFNFNFCPKCGADMRKEAEK